MVSVNSINLHRGGIVRQMKTMKNAQKAYVRDSMVALSSKAGELGTGMAGLAAIVTAVCTYIRNPFVKEISKIQPAYDRIVNRATNRRLNREIRIERALGFL